MPQETAEPGQEPTENGCDQLQHADRSPEDRCDARGENARIGGVRPDRKPTPEEHAAKRGTHEGRPSTRAQEAPHHQPGQGQAPERQYQPEEAPKSGHDKARCKYLHGVHGWSKVT